MVIVRRDQMKEKKKKRQLFLGPFQPELEEAFFDFVKNKKDRDPLAPLVVLVGSNLLGLYLQRLFVKRQLHHINIRFLTFIDLARALAEEPLSEDMRSPLPRFGDLVGIISLVEKLRENSYFKPIADRRGFQRALAATFRDLWDGGMEQIPVQEGNKLIELAGLYRAYRFMIGQDFYNDSELLFRSCPEVHNFFRVFGCEELSIYGFYDFTEGQKRLVRACANQLDVAAFMPWRGSGGFAYAFSTLQWYRELGFEAKTLERFSKTEKKSVEVLQRDLFQERSRGSKAPDDHTVLFVSAASETQEIREIARETLRLAKEEDINFHEMAILLRNAELYSSLILETFQSLEIPVYFQGGISLSGTQAGKSLLLLLDLIGSNLKRSKVMEFLTFAPIAWSRFFKEEPSPSQWDLISREAGIVEGMKQWEEKLASLISQEIERGSEEDQKERNSSGKMDESSWFFLKRFFLVLDRFPIKGTWEEISDATISLLEAYFEDGEIREGIFETLRELKSLDTLGEEIHVEQFKEILSEALKEKALKLGSFQKGGIVVSDLMPARGLSFRVVFIPGLVERAFPAPARQDPLLLDHERQAMNEDLSMPGRIPLKRFRSQEEKLLFTLAVGSAREKLILSYPRLDPSSGRERIPSFFLLRVAEALSGEAMDYSRLETLPGFRRVALSRLGPDDGQQAIDEEEFDLGQIARALKRNNRTEVACLKSLFPVLHRAEKLARLRWGFRTFTEYDGFLSSPQSLHLLRERFALSGQVLSPTRLETYASCPFKYFLSAVLGLRSLPFPEEILRIQPLERGAVVHDLLARFYREATRQIPGPFHLDQIERYEKVLDEVAERVFSEAEAAGLTGAPLLWEIDRGEILEDLRRFLKRAGEELPEWIPTHFEIRFGYQSSRSQAPPSPEAISLPLEGQSTVSFRGRIDRVDFSLDGSRLRVIDYKTGFVEGQPDGFSGGTALQLPLYLLASCRIWRQADIEKSFAEYDSVSRKGKFKRLLFHGENWGEKEKTLKKIIQIIAQGILTGAFFPCREEDRSCDSCDFQTLCEQGTGVLFQRKRNDPRVAAFMEMKKIP